MILATLIALSIGVPLPSCDLVEINHYHPDEHVAFTQVIAWDWDHQYGRWHAQQWAMVRSWDRAGNVTTIQSDIKTIRIRSKLFRETTTRHDPERDNRELFPTRYRRQVWTDGHSK